MLVVIPAAGAVIHERRGSTPASKKKHHKAPTTKTKAKQKAKQKTKQKKHSANSLNNRGPAGAKGDPGDRGAAGGKGDKGDKGDPGQPGANGLDSDQTRVVTATALYGFVLAPKGDNNDTTDNGTLGFATPPVAPNLGTKSLELTATTGKPVVVYVPLPAGTEKPLLAELTKASYESLVKSEPQSALDVALQIEVTGSTAKKFPSGYTTVVYEPYQNGSPDVPGVWHRHSFDNGKVWSSQALPSNHCTQAEPCSFHTFVEENPNAVVQTVKFRIGQNSGQGWPGFDGFVDDFSYGFGPVVRYDFGG